MYDCTFCTDEYCIGKRKAEDVAGAVTLVPFTQVIQTPGGAVVSVVALPCCVAHRKEQVDAGSKSGLLRA